MTQDKLLSTRIQQEIMALSSSMSGLMDSFKKLQNPLQESRKKVPEATDQLDKISEQTEAATHQMLDVVEKITQRDESILKDVEALISKWDESSDEESKDCLDKISKGVNANLNDAFVIMDALQFQDITSQQMNHAASLLEDIEAKLHNIIHVFETEGGESGPESVPVEARRRERAFDPHADLFDKKTEQKDIDQLFEITKDSK